MPKNPGGQSSQSHLFVVRIWHDRTNPTGDLYGNDDDKVAGATIFRGRVQRAVNGEAHDFQGWPELTQVLEAMLSTAQPTRKRAVEFDGNDNGQGRNSDDRVK